MKTRVLVAGAAGAVGRVLCRLLVDDGWRVVGTTRSPERATWLATIGVEPLVVDVYDRAALMEGVRAVGPDAVVHQLTDLPQVIDRATFAAALERNARLREIGTRHLVEASIAAGVGRVVAQSIAFAYAPGSLPHTEDSPLNLDASDPVAARTAAGVATLERLVLGGGAFVGIVLRYGGFYGPGTWSAVPAGACPVHVEAAADATRRALTHGAQGIYNVAEDDGTVTIDKARLALGWDPAFRVDPALS